MDSLQRGVYRPALDNRSHEPRIPSIPEARRDLHVPVEVCERIIDFVDSKSNFGIARDRCWSVITSHDPTPNPDMTKDRRRTLVACALTCRAWRSRSQFHLLRVVIIDDKFQLRRLQGILHADPTFSKYVAELALIGKRTDGRLMGDVEQWTSQLAFTLRDLPHVQTLSLITCDWRWPHPTFSVLVSCKASVTHLQLKHVNFATTRELVLLVFLFPNLTSLSLINIFCDKTCPYPKISRVSRTLPLVRLEVAVKPYEGTHHILRRLHETSSTQSLRSLSAWNICISPSVLQEFKTLLLSSPSLLLLDMGFYVKDFVPGTFFVASFAHL